MKYSMRAVYIHTHILSRINEMSSRCHASVRENDIYYLIFFHYSWRSHVYIATREVS